jgi:hypothetical protein
MKRIARYLVPIAGLTWVSFHFACQGPTLVTTAPPSPPGPVNGMLYYLPIGKITIKGEFKPALSGEKKEVKLSAAPAGKPGDGGGGSPTAGPDVVNAGELTITLTPEVEADETAGEYYVTPQTNDIFEDEVRVTVNSKQLLSTGKVTTEDKTAEIVGTIASIAAQAGIVGLAATPTPTPTPTPPPPPFYFSFHPSCPEEVEFVKEQLKLRDNISFEVKPAPLSCKSARCNAARARELGAQGLIFRPATSYRINLCYHGTDLRNNSAVTLIKMSQQFVMPDTNRLYEIQYPRMPFVKKVKDIGFRDGMLAEFHQKRPSPILGFLGIPKAIVQAIVPIPAAPPPTGSGSATGTTSPQ